MNKVMLIGRLVRDAELKKIEDRELSILTFTLAVNRHYKKEDKADFIPVVIFGKHAEVLSKYMVKGKLVGVEGKLQTRLYTNKEGLKKKYMEVICSDVRFLDPKKLDEVVNS
ncbi:single-stranded DNA-binding protein [Clostridium oceanicum]|uniref:Single-stranded DNA-binding protein n=1 Tax=Clostridium oceanicum TaxID=1543 RepID=A0ABP3UYQ0_9CLOT